MDDALTAEQEVAVAPVHGSNLATALRLTMLQLGFARLPWRTGSLVVLLALAAAIPAGAVIATGLVLDASAGTGDLMPAGTLGLVTAGAVYVAVYLLGQLVNALLDVVADGYGGRLQTSIEAGLVEARVTEASAANPALRPALAQVAAAPSIRQMALATIRYLAMRTQALFPGLVLIALVPVPGSVVTAAYLGLSVVVERDYRREQALAYAEAPESGRPSYLSGLAFERSTAREIRVFGAADWVMEQYDHLVRAARPAVRLTPALLSFLALALAATAYALYAIVGTDLSTGQITMCLAALVSLTMIFGVSMDIVYSMIGAEVFSHVRASLRAVASEPTAEDSQPNGPRAEPGRLIRFENVSFRYPGAPTPVFKALTFEVRLGHSLGIVGLNGAGKTTLMQLLSAVAQPTSGQITCDGVEVSAPNQRPQWRRNFAFLGQDFIRYPATLVDNIRLGRDQAPDDWSRRTRALIEDLDSKLITNAPLLVAGSGDGEGLSGGQWQRVATARASAQLDADNRGVLILDEPTAALDADAEARFFASSRQIAGPGRTTVMVSHRLSGVRRAEEILVLDSGRIAERGSHAELMNHNGIYAQMFNAQAARYGHDAQESRDE